jgi:hypothetical protein
MTEGVRELEAMENVCIPSRDEVTGGWIKLHNEELHNLYYIRHLTLSNLNYTFSQHNNITCRMLTSLGYMFRR